MLLTEKREIDSICDRFEAEWRAGGRPHIEDFLDGMSEPTRGRLFAELLALDLEYAHVRGEQPTADAYRGRFPEHLSIVEEVVAEVLAEVRTPAPSVDTTDKRDIRTDVNPGRAPRMPPAADELAAGGVVGDYEIIRRLGLGGMGVVFLARQKSADRDVALKLIRPDRLTDDATTRGQTIERFRKEALAAARLDHENIVTVYEVGEAAGSLYFSMQFIEGQSLAEAVPERPLDNRRAAELSGTVS